jgi:excisionase family DNA binding protein
MITIEDKNYLTIKELMEILKISKPTAIRYVHRGKVEAIRLRGQFLIPEDSYRKLLIPITPECKN